MNIKPASRRRLLLFLILPLAVFALSRGAPPPAAGAPGTPAIPTDQIVIRFDDATTRAHPMAQMDRLLDRLSAAAGMQLTFVRPMSGDAFVFRLPQPMNEAAAAAVSSDLAALPEVVWAEPDAIQTTIPVGEPVMATSGRRAANVTPNDPSFADQWHYRYTPGTEEGLNLPPAWEITTGSAAVVVAVIDTGIRPHADLAGRYLPGYDFIHDPEVANDGDGRDSDPSDPGDWITFSQCYTGSPAQDSSWHGTHVAGTIGAATNNGDDVAGVNWSARILPLRVLGQCGGYTSDIADAIRWAAGLAVPGVPPNPDPARVMNLSLGGQGTCSSIYQAAFDDARAAGAVAVVAAGNSSALADFYRPASCDGVITVAATNRVGDLAWYSNYGSVVEVSAPGGETSPTAANGVLSTLNSGETVPAADSLAFYQGTSMAAPHVAGLAALLIGRAPSLTPAQVSNLIEDTARDFPAGSDCAPSACGEGIADAYAALSSLDEELPAPELLAPLDGAALDTGAVVFEWSAVTGADGYGLVVATDPALAAAVIDTTVSDTSFSPAAPLADGVYYWRVNANDGSDFSAWSAVWSFTVDTTSGCAVPTAPALAAPDDGATTDDATPSFAWASVADATDYELQIDAGPAFSSPWAAETGELVYTPADPLEPGLYYWRVRGLNRGEGCDEPGAWSAVWSFTVDTTPGCAVPTAPALAAPDDGATTGDATPSFAWAPAGDATDYELQIDAGPAFSSPWAAETGELVYTPADPLEPGLYYWRVRGLNRGEGCDEPGAWSAVWSFTVEEPPPGFRLYLPGVLDW